MVAIPVFVFVFLWEDWLEGSDDLPVMEDSGGLLVQKQLFRLPPFVRWSCLPRLLCSSQRSVAQRASELGQANIFSISPVPVHSLLSSLGGDLLVFELGLDFFQIYHAEFWQLLTRLVSVL